MKNSEKMGFGSVLAIVLGSQIGSAIFMLPAAMAPYGMFGITGWFWAGLGAMTLAFVFAELCNKFPRTGGPYVFIKEVFGKLPGFFTGWTYWLISWVSTTVVVIASVGYLQPFIGDKSADTYLYAELILLLILTIINCVSVQLSGLLESFLTLLKFVHFVAVPALLFMNFDLNNISIASDLQAKSSFEMTSAVIALAFWGFIGVECATAPADAVENPKKNIPRAIIIGTLCVVIIYLVNSAAVMGIVPSAKLAQSSAPYVDAIYMAVGKNSSLIISIVASVVCIGTVNAWILSSAQIALGLAEDNMMPKIFAKKNKRGAPYFSVIISNIGMVPILFLTKNASIAAQIAYIIDFSVISFFFVYLACNLALLKLSLKENQLRGVLTSSISTIFCFFMILQSSLQSILISLAFVVSGVFALPYIRKDSNL